MYVYRFDVKSCFDNSSAFKMPLQQPDKLTSLQIIRCKLLLIHDIHRLSRRFYLELRVAQHNTLQDYIDRFPFSYELRNEERTHVKKDLFWLHTWLVVVHKIYGFTWKLCRYLFVCQDPHKCKISNFVELIKS